MKKYLLLFVLCSFNLLAEDGFIWKTEYDLLRGCFSIKEDAVFGIRGSFVQKINLNDGSIKINRQLKYGSNDFIVLPGDTNLLLGLKIPKFAIYNIEKDTILKFIDIPNIISKNSAVHLMTKSKDNKYLIANFNDSTVNNFLLLDLEQNKVISTLRDDKSDYRDYCVNDDFTVMYVLNRVGTEKNHEIKLIKFSLPDLTPVDTFRLNNYNQKTWLDSPIYIPNQNKVAIATDSGKVFIVDVSPNNDLNQYAGYETIQIPKDIDQYIMFLTNYQNNNFIAITGSGDHIFYNFD
jgi:hypothetical protein